MSNYQIVVKKSRNYIDYFFKNDPTEYFEITLLNDSNETKHTVKTFRDFLILDITFWKWIHNFDTICSFPEYQKYEFLDKLFSLRNPIFFQEKQVIRFCKFSSPSHILFFYYNTDPILSHVFKYNLPHPKKIVWNEILKNRTLFDLLSPLLCKMNRLTKAI